MKFYMKDFRSLISYFYINQFHGRLNKSLIHLVAMVILPSNQRSAHQEVLVLALRTQTQTQVPPNTRGSGRQTFPTGWVVQMREPILQRETTNEHFFLIKTIGCANSFIYIKIKNEVKKKKVMVPYQSRSRFGMIRSPDTSSGGRSSSQPQLTLRQDIVIEPASTGCPQFRTTAELSGLTVRRRHIPQKSAELSWCKYLFRTEHINWWKHVLAAKKKDCKYK